MDKSERKLRNITTTIPDDIYHDIKKKNLKISHLILIGYEVASKMYNKQNNLNLEDRLKEISEKLDKILNILQSCIGKQ
ncbi:MAG: hypothetical protein ACP5GJ_02580 [Nanopusillaceae archaeon]